MMLVSILIVTYNRARLIREAVQSALTQDYDDIEVIVVDDGSTDDTSSVVAELKDSRLRYLFKKNGGVSTARNRALEEARGEFILWLDSDDVLLPGTVSEYVRMSADNPDHDIFYGHLRLIDAEGRSLGERRYRDHEPDQVIPALVYGGICPQPGVFIRRRIFDEIGTFDPQMAYAEDYDLFARAAERFKFKLVDRFTCGYRFHGDQLCGPTNENEVSLDVTVIQRMVERYGLPRLFPDLYAADGPAAEDAAHFRLANVYHERTGHPQGEITFAEAVAMSQGESSSGSRARDEAAKCLYQVALLGRKRYRRYARACLSLWPASPEIWKHVALSALPFGAHRRMRGSRDAA
jgi:glycosyltransferase involved in cell wall biosynthesis